MGACGRRRWLAHAARGGLPVLTAGEGELSVAGAGRRAATPLSAPSPTAAAPPPPTTAPGRVPSPPTARRRRPPCHRHSPAAADGRAAPPRGERGGGQLSRVARRRPPPPSHPPPPSPPPPPRRPPAPLAAARRGGKDTRRSRGRRSPGFLRGREGQLKGGEHMEGHRRERKRGAPRVGVGGGGERHIPSRPVVG
ncbi:hypothetical protein I4F81_012357 [Pyropia yezoensis]|uniref:Uncharacterized protein n=1 Tax=Pyropia yezoensis TaxID=2788 RepID=A0ACC3CJF7_PYRYE|nr:hypothetical protein I4F81_012357 [Neopyropia yezoensis]